MQTRIKPLAELETYELGWKLNEAATRLPAAIRRLDSILSERRKRDEWWYDRTAGEISEALFWLANMAHGGDLPELAASLKAIRADLDKAEEARRQQVRQQVRERAAEVTAVTG